MGDNARYSTIEIPVLDHDYVKFIEKWGEDRRVIESARMSTDGAFKGWGSKPCLECLGSGLAKYTPRCAKCDGTGEVAGDENLLKYLWEHKYATPFEFCGLTFEIQAPNVSRGCGSCLTILVI